MLLIDNREIASLILLGAGILWVLSQEQLRASVAGVVMVFTRWQILVPLLAMLAWVGLELLAGLQTGLWNPALSKGTILWTLGSAGVLLFNCTRIDAIEHFLRRTIGATVGVAVFIEFFVNLYSMSLPVELLVQSVTFVLLLIITLAGQKPEFKSAKKFSELFLVGIVLAVFIHAARQIYVDWNELDARQLLLEFALPIWLTVGLLPFLYAFNIFLVYDRAFRQIDWKAGNWGSRWQSRLALLSTLRFRAGTVRLFTQYWSGKLSEAQSFSAARRVVTEFLNDQKCKQQTQKNQKERLRRYTGSQEVDEEGRRLDRREFTETIDALGWLATCQMGWYRNLDRYRDDLLKILDDFTRQGLPKESGITLYVAEDGQSWYAWRRTVTGWCFAIGASGPPPNRWEYDGQNPPNGFPGIDSMWGNESFSDQANLNWR
ncbi:MAG: hypothetical protein F4Y89_06920 [Gammaproteobacteria bacterium]|nr:hypothetical protein [Gammaproteobacteria bacterium]MYG97384.1 hypothetical protein [Gammaproteobacteria bacterium]